MRFFYCSSLFSSSRFTTFFTSPYLSLFFNFLHFLFLLFRLFLRPSFFPLFSLTQLSSVLPLLLLSNFPPAFPLHLPSSLLLTPLSYFPLPPRLFPLLIPASSNLIHTLFSHLPHFLLCTLPFPSRSPFSFFLSLFSLSLLRCPPLFFLLPSFLLLSSLFPFSIFPFSPRYAHPL